MKKPFSSLPKVQQRIAIAKDVLKWLRIGKIEATSGTYLEVYKTGDKGHYNDISNGLKEVNGHIACACALGSIFAVAADRSPTIRAVGFGVNSYQMRKKLRPYFSEKQLCLIENAFEQSTVSTSTVGWSWDEGDRAINFSYHRSPKFRMRKIMENIIKNKGEFVP